MSGDVIRINIQTEDTRSEILARIHRDAYTRAQLGLWWRRVLGNLQTETNVKIVEEFVSLVCHLQAAHVCARFGCRYCPICTQGPMYGPSVYHLVRQPILLTNLQEELCKTWITCEHDRA
jgi:hypothetical protein